MDCYAGYLIILESGVSGYLGCCDEVDACDRASNLNGKGWLFRFEVDGYASGGIEAAGRWCGSGRFRRWDGRVRALCH